MYYTLTLEEHREISLFSCSVIYSFHGDFLIIAFRPKLPSGINSRNYSPADASQA